jgi:hypothetical protein
MVIDPEVMRVWLEDSCALQGVSVVVTDAGVVAQVGVLLRGRDAAGPRREAGSAAPVSSVAPHGDDSERVERSASAGGGLDCGEVEDCADDRRLSA